MNDIRKSVSLFSKNKLYLNQRKFKHSETKVSSHFSLKKTTLIKKNSNNSLVKKMPSIIIRKDNLKLTRFEPKKTLEFNITRRSSIIEQSPEKRRIQYKKLLTKKYIEDKYLNCVKNKIYHKISKKYTSPYIIEFTEREIHPKNKQVESFTYYNYFLICNLISNKRCRFNLRYNEYIYEYNPQEYLIRYFSKNEIYIIMNYLLFIVYDRDISTKAKHSKKLLTYNEIRNMFNNLVNNNYNFVGSMEIMKDIAVYYKHRGSNNQNMNKVSSHLENIRPILGEKINYIYAKDIPNNQLPNCIPKYFQLEPVVFDYIKEFTNKRKYSKISRFNKNNQTAQRVKKRKQYYDSNKLKGNILTNISLFISKDKFNVEESKEIKENKRNHNSFRRMKNDCDIDDVEILVEKILEGLGTKNDNYNNKKYTKMISRKIIRQRSKRVNSMKVSFNHMKNKEKIFETSKFVNFKELNANELNKKMFTTSLKQIGIDSSKNDNRNNKSNPINNLMLNKDKDTKIYLNINGAKKGFKKIINLNKLKNKTTKNEDVQNKRSKKLIRFDGLNNNKSYKEQKLSLKNSTNKINSNSIKETSSNDSLFFHKIKDISKFLAQSRKNKYSLNKYFSLKKLKSFSTKNILIPKKAIFKGPSKKAFSTYSGMNFENKEINIWENNKIDTDIINVAVKTSFLLNKIGNSYDQKMKSSHNCNTLKKLIKYPLIYFSNCK